MDPNLPQSKSVPSNLIIGRRHRVSISVSGSYQSHLGYLCRVRTVSEQIPLGSADLEKDYLHLLEGGLADQLPRPRTGRLCLLKQLIIDPATLLSDDFRRIRGGHVWQLRTLLTLYCCFSILLLTTKIQALSREALQIIRPQQHQPWESVPNFPEPGLHDTSLMNVTLPQRLSVAFRELSPQAHLNTFVVQSPPSYKSDLTACFWIEDVRVDEALVSATAWPGPMSLVVVTANAPNSTEYKTLLGYLAANRTTSNTSVHVLHVPSVAGGSSNVYLNMARFFARTSRVVLFPDRIPRSALLDHTRWIDKLPIDTTQPIILSDATHRAFSPKLPAPVVLPRDHPVWCTERFYMFGSRVLDWEDCLWKLWLEGGGEASLITVPDILDGSKNTSVVSVPLHATKNRLRWSTKYRSEACGLALKRPRAPASLSKTEKRRMQWRKKFCRETLGPAPMDIP